MGRLTLNVLLSFAHFEREVTGERIRDKIAASKRKGLWMGGPVPLGYQVVERKLVPVPEEAERVRYIMRCYLEMFSAPRLLARLKQEGVLTKVQHRVSGPHRGGIPFRRGSLFYLLKNPVYRGKIVHRGTAHDGEHEPIVDQELWDAVHARLREKAPPRKRPKNDRQSALLMGLLADPQGRQIVPTYATKGTRRYAYYETRKDLARPPEPPSTRFGQGLLDGHVLHHLGTLLGDDHSLRRLANLDEADLLRTIFECAKTLEARLKQPSEAQAAIRSLVALIKVRKDGLELTLKSEALGLTDRPCWRWNIPLPAHKPFREAKVRIDDRKPSKPVNDSLLSLLADARAALDLVHDNPELSLHQIGKREGRCRTHLARLLRIAWLSPRIVEAITEGNQPRKLSRQALLGTNLPIDWAEQERLLGFAD